MEGLARGLHGSSLDGFYQLARSVCVKDVSQFDAFDQGFLSYFKDVHEDALEITDELLDWLNDPKNADVPEEQRKLLEALDLDTLRELFEQRLKEQNERHDGGSKWIGTGGRSPFGSGGVHPSGIRLGAGGGRSAMQVAAKRRYQEYRKDAVLDVRQIDLALRRLRRLGRDGVPDELNLDETIEETGRNAGDLSLVFSPPKRNRLKLVLLMDVGGSMTPYARLVERLFTAASRNGRFARFRSFYFHNCVYDAVYKDANFTDPVPLATLFGECERSERLVLVGDALMHPAELLHVGGAIDYWYRNPTAGIDWLRQLKDNFRHTAWLNPEPERFWKGTTIEYVANIFPMWELTLDGLEKAIAHLIRAAN